MPGRTSKGSMDDLMAKMPVNKGSLLTSIDNLLKTIESSESTVMIPTLLRDKCEFDAWELLFVAKILKASILGHSDLVEFYMNHISHQKNLVTTPSAATCLRQASSPALSPASHISVNNSHNHQSANGHTSNSHHTSNGSSTNGTSSSASSISSQTSSTSTATATTATGPSSSSTGWTTATSQQQQQPQPQQVNHRSASSSLSSSASSSTHQAEPDIELVVLARALSSPSMSASIQQRQAQPPSLLQLTTTNNHINIINNRTVGAIEQLASSALQMLSNQPTALNNSTANSNGFELGSGALSISTTTTNQQQQPSTPTSAGIIHHELKSSRSAGCLFRNSSNQSGASSPRTPLGQSSQPTTPCQAQAETLANGGSTNQLIGDPSEPVKLLLQIEQLKSSIVYVTNLLENVVDLYKKSIDNIA